MAMPSNLDSQYCGDDLSIATWDKSYDLQRARNLWGEGPVPYIERAIETFEKHGGTRFLDMPCGDGRNTVALARKLPYIVGADTSMHALQIAGRALASHQIRNCILMVSDVFNAKFLDDQFDGVLCWDLLGHLKNVSLAIGELLRICRPGGHIIGSLFSRGDPTRGRDMFPIGNEEYIYTDRFYFKFYGEQDVLSLLGGFDAGLVSLELVSWAEPPHEGYREYSHEHESWAFTIEKR
jgi:SAM-dependent methyltransferase